MVQVGEHHDGFPMYASAFTPWNAANLGPCRDVVAEVEQASRAAGLKFGVSSHRAFNWRYYTFGRGYDTDAPENVRLYGRLMLKTCPLTQPFSPTGLAA